MRKAVGLVVLIAQAMGCSEVTLAQQGSGSRRPSKNGEAAMVHNQGGNEGQPAAATQDPSYIIGPDDMLNIDVWKEPEISRAVPVRPDGRISLPLLNDVRAAGLTPSQLGTEIKEKLRKYLTDPQVTVIVTQTRRSLIYILGEVKRTGSFELLPNMTVLQALSTAGGFSDFADPKKIYVLRSESGKQVKFPFNYMEVIRGRKPEQNIQLKPGDTIVVP